MTDLNQVISVIVLKVKELKIPVKRQRLSDCCNAKIQLYTIHKRPTENKDTKNLKG